MSQIEFLVLTGDAFMMCNTGLGVHMWDMTVRTQIKFFKVGQLRPQRQEETEQMHSNTTMALSYISLVWQP